MNTSTAGFNKPITLEDIEKAVEVMKSIPENKEWIVITPDGKCYKGEFDKVLPVFMQHHPLMQINRGYGIPYSQATRPNDQ